MDGIVRLNPPAGLSITPGEVFYIEIPDSNSGMAKLSASCPTLPKEIVASIDSRKREYLAGRYCASQALIALGSDDTRVERNNDRSPCWPEGTCGSLSHAQDRAIACVGWQNDFCGIGIDIEKNITHGVLSSLQALVFTPQEQKLVHNLDFPILQAATLIFSAKESVYKYIYPQTNCELAFTDISLISFKKGVFYAELPRREAERWPNGNCVQGQYCFDGDFVITLIML